MATLNLSGGKGKFTWSISGLGSAFNTTNYKRAGISTSAVSSGASSVSGVVSSKTASSSGTSTSTGTTTVTRSAGTYTFYGFAQAANGLYYPAGSGSVTVTMPDPTTTWSVSVPSSGERISISITADSNYPYHKIWWKKGDDTASQYPSTSNTYSNFTSRTLTGLTPGEEYTISLDASTGTQYTSSNGVVVERIGTKYATPAYPPMDATYTTTHTATSITVNVTVDSDYKYYRIHWRQTSDSGSGSQYPTTGFVTQTSNFSYTITGLSPDTSYYINVAASYDKLTAGTSYIGQTTVTTDSLPTVTPWSWTSANSTVDPAHTAEATASQTTAARNACQNKTAVSNFKYQVWNDLVYKVYEARKASGHSTWNTYYATLSNTLMTSSSKTLTATRYNSLKYNLGEIYSTGISDVSAGDSVLGTTHFINFVTKLNTFINSL